MKRIIAISLSMLLLLSNMGLAISTHYCGGKAVQSQLAIGQAHLDCGMLEALPPVCTQTQLSKTMNCCENSYLSYELQDDFKLALSSFSINLDFVYVLAFTFIDFHLSDVGQFVAYSDYSPPLLHQDIPVLFQSFLI
ncbi:HYC_CC_PP family protein [Reichenbachiella agariperforans]|uniref:HYC_CC_PP family protein n=1 Tax=Reichenbachiella agariperforans TaxID=156994 RepID=UPI001C09B822|nr:hypothetical protein [Reichenbachiella agariperforans]MBU2915014.1 hypothetical protein [Reichenbachiella agariperforans]